MCARILQQCVALRGGRESLAAYRRGRTEAANPPFRRRQTDR